MLRVALQVLFVAAVAAVILWLYGNLITNMRARGIRTDYGFLRQPAGFAISGTDFRGTQPIRTAILTGLANTLRVAVIGVALASVLGVIVGVLRLSTNWLVRRAAGLFVEAFRNVPHIILIQFMYLAVLQRLPGPQDPVDWGILFLSNRGLWVPWAEMGEGSGAYLLVLAGGVLLAVGVAWWRTRRFDATGQPHHRFAWGLSALVLVALAGWAALGGPVTPTFPEHDERVVRGGLRLTVEYGALLIALVLYTAAFIAEIVRGAIQSVPKGQTEAATAVGLSSFQRLRLVVLPQALRIAVPPTGNEYLNLTKNTALGVVIAYPELLRVTRIVVGNGHPAPQAFALMLSVFLAVSLAVSALVNLANWVMQRRGGIT